MRVKLSSDAQRDIREQIAYLRGKTNSGLVRFRETVARGLTLLSDHPNAGFAEAQIPIHGARRIIVDGWYFDYEVIDAAVWVHRITSSVNTPLLPQDENADYEDGNSGD